MQPFKFDDKTLEEMKKRFSNIAKRVRELVSKLFSMFENVIKSLKKLYKYNKKYVVEIIKSKPPKYKLNFIRPIIKHQVLERRPRNIVRKVL